jgi:DNA-binding response OmpR family regulator
VESVLVVEDEEAVAGLYQQWLLDAGYDVRVANSGESALDYEPTEFDVVCLDRQLPGKNGKEVLATLRSRGIDARVVMITGIEPDFDIVEMAFDDYLVKPVARSELLDTVASLTQLSTYDDAVREYFALSSKKAVLTANKPRQELHSSEEYEQLVERLDATASVAADATREFDHDEYEILFRDFDPQSETPSSF